LFIDLIGFGRSDKPDGFDYSINSQGAACLSLLNYLGIRETILVAHSMGGMIAQIVAEGSRVKAFINCEGNLILDDCRLAKTIVKQGFSKFAQTGFADIKAVTTLPASSEALAQTTALVMYQSSRQVVESCVNDQLLDRFIRLKVPKLFLYGEQNRGRRRSQEFLQDTGIPIQYISGSGHNMFGENPEECCRVIADFLADQHVHN
jgi:pimeloyl-ACP methyl ester carboxylesterase